MIELIPKKRYILRFSYFGFSSNHSELLRFIKLQKGSFIYFVRDSKLDLNFIEGDLNLNSLNKKISIIKEL